MAPKVTRIDTAAQSPSITSGEMAVVVATAFDESNSPLPDAELTYEWVLDNGTAQLSDTTGTKVTDSGGEAMITTTPTLQGINQAILGVIVSADGVSQKETGITVNPREIKVVKEAVQQPTDNRGSVSLNLQVTYVDDNTPVEGETVSFVLEDLVGTSLEPPKTGTVTTNQSGEATVTASYDNLDTEVDASFKITATVRGVSYDETVTVPKNQIDQSSSDVSPPLENSPDGT